MITNLAIVLMLWAIGWFLTLLVDHSTRRTLRAFIWPLIVAGALLREIWSYLGPLTRIATVVLVEGLVVWGLESGPFKVFLPDIAAIATVIVLASLTAAIIWIRRNPHQPDGLP